MNQQEKKNNIHFLITLKRKKKKHLFLHFLKTNKKRFRGAWHKGLNAERML